MAEGMLSNLNLFFRKRADFLPSKNPLRIFLSGLWQRYLELSHSSVSLPFHGETLKLTPKWRSFSIGYEKKALESWLSLISPNETIWDVGAHVGIYTMLAARKVGRHGRVVAWEASPKNFENLKIHIEQNQLRNHCYLLNWAIDDGASSEVRFKLDPKSQGGDSHRIATDSQIDKASPMVRVPAASLDQWIKVLKVVPSLIKIDIEGAEGLALSGAKELMSGKCGSRPLIFLSVHPHFLWEFNWQVEELDPFVAEMKYQVLDIKGENTTMIEHSEYWLVPKARVNEVKQRLKKN